MDCIIPGLNVKVFARALQALAKVGDELFIEARSDKLSLLTFNMSKTVCAQFHLLDSYFSRYIVNKSNLSQDNCCITCKIHMKNLLPLFKGTHLEKKLDFVKIEYKLNCDLIIFRLNYKLDDIVMVHKLRLMEPEVLSISSISISADNNICASSEFYNQLLSVFSSSDSDITFEITKEKVVVRNYCTGAPQKSKSVRSQVKLNASEFTQFQIKNETTVNFSLKPLRTAIHFAECFNLNIGFEFEKGGRPLNMFMKHPTFEVKYMIATLDPYNDAVSTIACSSLPTRVAQPHETLLDLTADDIAAIQNENWSDCEMDTTGHLRESASSSDKSSKKLNDFASLMDKAKKKNAGKNASLENGKVSDEKIEKSEKNRKKLLIDLDDNHELEENDVIANSPESPRTKRLKVIFKRSLEPTFHKSMIEGDLLAPDSDPE